MFSVVITEKGGAQRRMEFDKNEVTIGRVQGNDIILPKGNVSKRHSRIVLKDARFIVVDLKSTNGTYVNGRKITSPLVVKPGDKIYIGDFILTLEEPAAAAQPDYPTEEPQQPPPPQPPPAAGPPPLQPTPMQAPPSAPAHPPPSVQQSQPMMAPPSAQPSQPMMAPPSQSSPHMQAPQPAPPMAQPQPPAPQPPPPQPPAPEPPPAQPAPPPLPARAEPAPPPPAPTPQRFPLDEEPAEDSQAGPPLSAPQHRPPSPTAKPAAAVRRPAPSAPRVSAAPTDATALRAVMARVSQGFDVHDADPGSLHDTDRRGHAQSTIQQAIGSLRGQGAIDGSVDASALADAALREAVGLGAIEPLLSDESVREIVVEGPGQVLADRGQGLEASGGSFSSASALVTVCRRLVAQAGEILEDHRLMHEVTLPYGPHVSIVLPPIAVRGPIVEIRRTAPGSSADELASSGVMSAAMLDVLTRAVEARRNIAVVGTTGSGVTTVLGALASLGDPQERIVSVEEVPDLSIDKEHVISLSTGGPGSGLRLSDIVRQAGRMRADRLVVDDVSGADAFDVLTAVAARGDGNFVGLHCATNEDAVGTIQMLARLTSRADEDALAELIARAVHVVVQVAATPDGRRVVGVLEVSGADGGSVQTSSLFVYDGGFSASGRPSFA